MWQQTPQSTAWFVLSIMAGEQGERDLVRNGPSSSMSVHPSTSSYKRLRGSAAEDEAILLPLSDQNMWYYPSHGYDSEEDMGTNPPRGNWGNKHLPGARWARNGKITSWGPGMDDWEAEERSRKRIKLLLPHRKRSLSPPTLSHLSRSPSPPLTAPYPQASPHLSYSSFVLDKAITHTFRSKLLDELEHATNGLIEGEATMKRALGRLWQVMSEDPDQNNLDKIVPKREDEEADGNTQTSNVPDLTPPIQKLFFVSYPNNTSMYGEQSHFTSPQHQHENLERAMAVLRELQDDGREYVERLQEIREGLGDVRAHRDGIWDMVRARAIQELQDAAFAAAS
ncbi:hypothetical protein E1B28_001344 [Marasmius oreades]|uniref:Uncharacterized protein n=1 Tax=Marasmius oreades TaxID=181124 RepID=A0A9P7V3D7_9AGAR|nr:uncharacterized protein E1B28_001344 [Marasmius oreades]KAG7099498.1 hypothetical protein E1B28_001344 [Marasmius oreades]